MPKPNQFAQGRQHARWSEVVKGVSQIHHLQLLSRRMQWVLLSIFQHIHIYVLCNLRKDLYSRVSKVRLAVCAIHVEVKTN